MGLAAAYEWRAIGYDGADRSMDIKRRKLLMETWRCRAGAGLLRRSSLFTGFGVDA